MCKLTDFITKANIKHSCFYDYSKVQYKSAKEKVKIICPIHGLFEQTPAKHLAGSSCKQCSIDKRTNTKDDFITKSNIKHNYKYDYSKINQTYVRRTDKVTIICPIHGEFKQLSGNHLNGLGCKHCGDEKIKEKLRSDINEIIIECKTKHNDFYQYKPPTDFTSKRNTKLSIICPIHGEFKQSVGKHLSGQGCPKCKGGTRDTLESYMEKVIDLHQDQFSVTKNTIYTNAHSEITLSCKDHGEFSIIAYQMLNKYAHCPVCKNQNNKYISSQESVLTDILSVELQTTIENNKRDIIAPYELDIFIPSKNLAIEINGIYWHSEIYKDSQYHYNKYRLCLEKGIRLLQFYDQEINNNLDWVIATIKKTVLEKPAVYKKILVNNRLDSVLNYPGYRLIKEYEPVLEERYTGNHCHKIWNAGYTLIEI